MGELVTNNCWKTSVTELLTIFRGALLAIIPWLEKARIKWNEGEAYDDWDNITESLFKNIVCSSLIGEVTFNYPIAKYNYNYDNYATLDFIEVKSKDYYSKRLVFVGFQTNSSSLDSVKVAEINEANKVVGYTNLEWDDLVFVYVKNTNNEKDIIESIEIEL
jgi:hypothetical protein